MKFVLASNSPRRKKLLSQFNLSLSVTSHSFDESSVSKKLNPEEYCRLISEKKAKSICNNHSTSTILSADTIVTIDNNILEKPINKNDAVRMLNLLSGRQHEVVTGVTIINNHNNIDFSFTETTIVTFNKIPENEIVYYIDKYKPYDKSGSYGIQDFSAIFVKSIEGCFFNVVGLPLSSLFYYLKKFNLIQFPLNTGN